MTADPDELRRAAGHFATGVTVVAARHAAGPCGLTVNAFMTVSLEPPLVLVAIGRSSRSLPCVERADRFGLSVLAEDQEDVSRLFASKDEEKFARVGTHDGASGVPLVDGAVAYLECRTTQRLEAGDHVLFLAEVERVSARDGRPLLFHRGRYRRLADDT